MRTDVPAWIQHAFFFFFFVSLYLWPLLTNEELSICSRTFVTSSMTATIELLVPVVFLVFASVLEVLQSISCLPCAPQTSLASRENFCASFFFGSTAGHCPSPYQIVAIQRCGAAELLSHRKGALALIYFPLSNCRSPTETGMSGRSSLPTQWRRWPADKMHQASTLERGLVMVYLRSTQRHTGSDTQNITEPGRKEETVRSHLDRRRCAIFFLRFQSDLRPGPPVMYRAACREAQRDFAQR